MGPPEPAPGEAPWVADRWGCRPHRQALPSGLAAWLLRAQGQAARTLPELLGVVPTVAVEVPQAVVQALGW